MVPINLYTVKFSSINCDIVNMLVFLQSGIETTLKRNRQNLRGNPFGSMVYCMKTT